MKLAEMDQKTSRNMCKNVKNVAVALILRGYPPRMRATVTFFKFLHIFLEVAWSISANFV